MTYRSISTHMLCHLDKFINPLVNPAVDIFVTFVARIFNVRVKGALAVQEAYMVVGVRLHCYGKSVVQGRLGLTLTYLACQIATRSRRKRHSRRRGLVRINALESCTKPWCFMHGADSAGCRDTMNDGTHPMWTLTPVKHSTYCVIGLGIRKIAGRSLHAARFLLHKMHRT